MQMSVLLHRLRQNIIMRLTKKAHNIMLHEQLRCVRTFQFLTCIADKRLLRCLLEAEKFRLKHLVSV